MSKILFGASCSFLWKLKTTFMLIAGVMLFLSSHSFAKDNKIQINIPSQNLRSALIEFANITDLSLIYDIEGLGNKESKAVSGVYAPVEALGIMLKDTGLTFEKTGEESIAINKKSSQHGDNDKNSERSSQTMKKITETSTKTSNQDDVMTNKEKKASE